MRVFIFYHAHLEIEKDFQEREKLFEQIKVVDKRLQIRNGLLIGMLKGIIETKKGQNRSVQENLLITGGTELKYQGITIHKHKSCNTWYARYRSGGKQFYISARTQQACYDKLKVALAKKNNQELRILNKPKELEKPTITFVEWYKKWKSLYKKDVKPSTEREYLNSMNHLQKLHNLDIRKITSLQILEQINLIKASRSRQKAYEFVCMLFEKAFVNELIEKNPMLVIEKPKHRRVKGNALTNEDEKKLVSMFEENNADVFLICLYQGLRRGEVLALTIADVDFQKKTLTISKSLNFKNQIDTTKNESSNRVMPLFEKTEKILIKYQKVQGRIFPAASQTLEKEFLKYSKNFDIRYTIHSLRHTFVTKCQESGIPLHIIQSWVGHTIGSAVTNSVYTHSRTDAEAENIKIYNKKLNSN